MSNRNVENRHLRDKALKCYIALRQGRKQEVIDFLDQGIVRVQDTNCRTLDCSYWLWILGQIRDYEISEEQSNLVIDCINVIGESWHKVDHHWLWPDKKGLFLSNIAIHHAALRSINNRFHSETAQKICKEIREITFKSFMKENHFVSRKDTAEILGDITVAAVPFGLVSAGDLAMLSAINKRKEEEILAESAAIMSWYYSEIGQKHHAKEYLNKADTSISQVGNGSFSILEAAKNQFVHRFLGTDNVKREEDGEPTLIHFNHDPVGGECPYIFGQNERSPRIVTVNTPITIRTFVEPFNPKIPVVLEYANETGELRNITMSPVQTTDGDSHWQVDLPVFSKVSTVKYRFKVEIDAQIQTSEWYSFEVLNWCNVNRVVGVKQIEQTITVFFEPLLQGGVYPCLTFSNADTVAVNCIFSLEKEIKFLRDLDFGNSIDGHYRTGVVHLNISESRLHLQILDKQASILTEGSSMENNPLLQLLSNSNGEVIKARLNFRLNEEEKIYGMGERFARMEFTGFEVDNYVFNQYKDQGFRTYMPVPFMFSLNGYGLFLQSSLYSVFRFATVEHHLMQIEADVHPIEQTFNWYLFSGKPLEIIEQFTTITGKPKLPPKWAFGPWMSSNNWDSEKEVDWQLEQTLKYEIPSTVMVIEQWSDESTFYIFNDAQYELKAGEDRFTYDDFIFPAWGRWPNPKKLVERIHEQGIKVLLWQAPVMKFMDGIPHVQRDEDERSMIEHGYGVKNKNGTPYRIPEYEWFRGSLVPDFTNPDAANWWFSKRQYLLDEICIDGFKTDGGECIYGSDVQFYDGRTGKEMRNEYPNSYVEAFHRFVNEHVSGGGITFSRAGYTGAQNMPLHWAGDEKSTFEAFRSSIIAGLSCGMSGIPFWGWDLGGFSGEIPSAELYVRSTQMAAFCPVMQYHAESKGEFNLDRTPWNIADRYNRPDVLKIYKYFADLRMNLLPYIYEQAILSSVHGYPLMSAMFLLFPDDSMCHDLTEQYMFGQSLLVAPVTQEGANEKEVYLPQGNWISLFSSEVFYGKQKVTIPVDLTQIPVFMRENSVIPLNLRSSLELASDVGNHTDRYNRLCMMVFVTDEIHYHFKDEQTNDINIIVTKKDQKIEASIEISGSNPIILCFRMVDSVSEVVRNEISLRTVSQVEHLHDGYFIQRNNDLLIPLQQGKWSIMID